MHVDVMYVLQIGQLVVLLYLVWIKVNLEADIGSIVEQVEEIIEKHNSLCEDYVALRSALLDLEEQETHH
jgi:hypothetical protein